MDRKATPVGYDDAGRPSGDVEIRPDVVNTVAGHVGEVRDLIAKATSSGGKTPVTDATASGTEGLSGWISASTLTDVLTQWSRKSRALTDGPGGLKDYASALKGLVTETGATDVANAGAIDATMKSFQEPYRPHLTDADMGPVGNFVEDRVEDVGEFFGGLNAPGS